jgi:hypothetical protein
MKNKGVELEVFDPTGAGEVTHLHAPRLSDLNGKTICELSNGLWEAHRIFPLIRELLTKQFPDVKIIPYTEFPVGKGGIDDEKIAEMVKKKGGHAVITGTAG